MKYIKLFVLLFSVLSITSCKKSADNSEDSEEVSTNSEVEVVEEAYSDDTYCADVDYYNPDTGTRNSYTLNVEVEGNEVVRISFSSGWLDSSEFSSEELDSGGACSITCFDGRQFDIQITGSECTLTDAEVVSTNDYYEKQKLKCPECGGKKYSYDDVCDDCKDKAEHTCKKCGQEDSFMWSTDELCSDCKREDEDKQREEEG
jgi:hypothetical protein